MPLNTFAALTTAGAGAPVRVGTSASGTRGALPDSPPAFGSADPVAIERAMASMNEMLRPLARSLHFTLDGTTGRTVVKLVDRETNEVIRQIPTEEMLSIARALDRVQGVLLRSEA